MRCSVSPCLLALFDKSLLAGALIGETLLSRCNLIGLSGTKVGVESTTLVEEGLLGTEVITHADVAEAIASSIWGDSSGGREWGASSINRAKSRLAVGKGALKLLGTELVESFETAKGDRR